MASFALTPRVAGLILAVCVITTFSSHAFAQGPNPLIGTWKVNLAKSTFSPGPPPKSPATRTYTQNGDGLKLVSSGGVNAAGSAQPNQSYAAHFDGKDYPFVGSTTADTVMITMVGASTLDVNLKKGGKAINTVRFTVSKDGKTMTMSQGGTNAAGLPQSNFVVFDKQ